MPRHYVVKAIEYKENGIKKKTKIIFTLHQGKIYDVTELEG